MKQLLGMLVSLAALLIWPAASVAQDAALHDRTLAELAAEVPGHTGISFFDLVKQVIPDLIRHKTGASGHQTVRLHHIAGDGVGGTIPDSIKIGLLHAFPFESEGRSRIAMLIRIGTSDDMGEQPAILAVFDDDGRMPTLLDAVDVALDRMTSFAEPALLRIGARDDAILTTSQHFNSSENYTWTVLIFLRGGKLGLIDKFFAFGVRTCTLQGTQTFSFKGAPEAATSLPYYAVTVTMSDIGEPPEERCDDGTSSVPYARHATAVYRWDAGKARFVPDSDAVQRLQAQTAEP